METQQVAHTPLIMKQNWFVIALVILQAYGAVAAFARIVVALKRS